MSDLSYDLDDLRRNLIRHIESKLQELADDQERNQIRRHNILIDAFNLTSKELEQVLSQLKEHIDTQLEEHAHTQNQKQIERHNIMFDLVEEVGAEQVKAVGEIESRISDLSDRLEEIEKRLKR
jgi:hypothetical protein